MNPFFTIRIGAGLRRLNEPYEKALDHAHEEIAEVHRAHWKGKIMTVVGGPANKIAYITGAFHGAVQLAKRVREGTVRSIDVQSDLYTDPAVAIARAPGIGRLIERGATGYPGRFQAQLAVEAARRDTEDVLKEHIFLANRRIERG